MHETSIDRRTLIGTLAALVGASALPMDVLAAATGKAKPYLAPAPFALLEAVADTLVPDTDTPGAVAVGVPRILDGMLATWAAPETRTTLATALSAIDAAAVKSDGKSFAALSPARRKAMLTDHDLAALKPVPRTDGLSGFAAFLGAPSVADPGYSRLKTLVVTLYYASEVGLTREVIYEHVPGPWVPSLKITPETRPFAGPTGTF